MSSGYSVEVGWLIEIRNPTRWWTGSNGSRVMGIKDPRWSSDSLSSIRFARRLDAELVIHENDYMVKSGAIATEHRWGLG